MNALKDFYGKYGAALLALLAAGLMIFVLYGGEETGLSNNGDFTRIMKTNSLRFVTPDDQPYVYQPQFLMDFSGGDEEERTAADLLLSLEGVERYPSIHLLFVRVSMGANMAFNALTGADMDTYRVGVLGLIYLLCYAGLLFLLFRSFSLPRPGADLAVKLLILFVLCDEGYLTYFNSLYSEPVQMLGLLAVAIFSLRAFTDRGRRGVNLFFLFLSCTVYGWAKLINLPVGVLCIVALGLALLPGLGRGARVSLTAWGLVCILALGAVYTSLPQWMNRETNYNALFFGVLKDTDRPQQEEFLAELNMPAHIADLAYSTYYSQRGVAVRGDTAFEAPFSTLSKTNLLLLYLRHPGYLLEKLDVAVAHSGFIRPYYLSNLDENHPRLSFAGRLEGWSYLRGQLPFDTWAGNGVIVLAGGLSLWWLLRRTGHKKGAAAAVVALLGALIYQLVMPIITNGEADLAKHMFAFAQLIDLLLLFLVARLGYFLCRREHVKHPAVLLVGGLASLVTLCFLSSAAIRQTRIQNDTVMFGTWEGRPIIWQVVAREGNTATLLATEPVAALPFSGGGEDGFGSSLWAHSSLRAWLNTTFLTEAFTDGERAILLETSHSALLSGANNALGDSGYNEFYAFHVPRYSDRGMDIAFTATYQDRVRLPDIGMLAGLSRSGRLSPAPCWMDTAYYNNRSMLRTLGPDGYFYMRDAAQAYGVRPVITVFFPGST